MKKNILVLVAFLTFFGCKNDTRTPKEIIEEFSAYVIKYDVEKAKRLIDDKYWAYLEEDIRSTKKYGYSSARMNFGEIDNIECQISKNVAICNVYSFYNDSVILSTDVELVRKSGLWTIGEGIYTPVCCD
jgi:hypothetical protein